ncbi:pantoate--beta-alanine ligase [Pontibacter arcticus]|uniref:Pantothenate synthetase n=1 Tax=Pontibacter arcticus TaxID=2080288 RepID=A0A364RJ01_9BACT|nr:pantoate--beta-alanine ligase [Pontibacter arcticus]RAU84206.1 pantoate--beta-alanine ligase [Pontibacter arcticus]
MEVITQAREMLRKVQELRCSGKTIGFVPTMGALHEGHLQLLRASGRENDVTVCSIFVNPTQFNNPDDYTLYPRTLEQDSDLLESINCTYLFAPTAAEMYPQPSLLQFGFGALEGVMEGEKRPGHFNGVATVVSKLFHLVQPHRAYFGQKDLQQVAILRQLVQGLSFDLELVCFPTVREPDGLAMSSRNKRLTPEQRQQAIHLYKALQQAASQLSHTSVESIKQEAIAYLNAINEIEVEYFEIVDVLTLQPLQSINPQQEVAICVAAFVGEVRLIDNLLVNL